MLQAHPFLDNFIFRSGKYRLMLGVSQPQVANPDQPEPIQRIGRSSFESSEPSLLLRTDKYGLVIVEELMPALKKDLMSRLIPS